MTAEPLYPTAEQIERCESVEEALRWQLFLPSPTGEEEARIINLVMQKVAGLRVANAAAYVAAHKRLTRRPDEWD